MGISLQVVCATDGAVEEPAEGTCQGRENCPSVSGSLGGPLCQVTRKQALWSLRESGPVGAGAPTNLRVKGRAGQAGQRVGSAGGLVVACWGVHLGSAPGGPAWVPFSQRTWGSRQQVPAVTALPAAWPKLVSAV